MSMDGRAERHLAIGLTGALVMFEHIEWAQPGSSLVITQEKVACGGSKFDLPKYMRLNLTTQNKLRIDWHSLSQRCQYSPVPLSFNGVQWGKEKGSTTRSLLDQFLPPRPGREMAVPCGQPRGLSPGEGRDVWVENRPLLSLWLKPPKTYLLKSYPGQVLTLDRARCSGFLQILRADEKQSTIVPVVDGVSLDPIRVESPISFNFVVANPPFEQDLSEFQTIQSEALKLCIAKVRQEVFSLCETINANASLIRIPSAYYPKWKSQPASFGPWCFVEHLPTLGEDEERYLAAKHQEPFLLADLSIWYRSKPWDFQTQERFLQDLEYLSRLRHPNVVQVMDYGRINELIYRADKPTNFKSLTEVLPPGGYLLEEASALIVSLCRSLKEILVRFSGIPVQVLVREYLVKDLEICLRLETNVGISKERVRDSRQYMMAMQLLPPERILHYEKCDLFTHQYEIGVMGYYLFTGRGPFEGEELTALMHAIMQETPPDPRTYREDIPRHIAETLQRCLEKDPSKRFADLDELLAAFNPS